MTFARLAIILGTFVLCGCAATAHIQHSDGAVKSAFEGQPSDKLAIIRANKFMPIAQAASETSLENKATNLRSESEDEDEDHAGDTNESNEETEDEESSYDEHEDDDQSETEDDTRDDQHDADDNATAGNASSNASVVHATLGLPLSIGDFDQTQQDELIGLVGSVTGGNVSIVAISEQAARRLLSGISVEVAVTVSPEQDVDAVVDSLSYENINNALPSSSLNVSEVTVLSTPTVPTGAEAESSEDEEGSEDQEEGEHEDESEDEGESEDDDQSETKDDQNETEVEAEADDDQNETEVAGADVAELVEETSVTVSLQFSVAVVRELQVLHARRVLCALS